ncbi:MAG: T9SS type A sorting domain-containing protein [Flavobacteriales bacterium]
MKKNLLIFLIAFFAISISSLYAQSLVDLEATTVLSPTDGCVLGAHESITVQITNTGGMDVDTVYLYYQVDSGTVVSEVLYDTIAIGSSYNHTFSSSYDFSSAGSYYVAFWLSCPGDTLYANDTTNVTTTLAGDLPLTITMNTAGYGSEVSWNIQDSNDSIVLESQGSLNSYSTYTDEICLSTCQTYTFNMHDSWGDGWNGGTYTVTTPNQIDTLPPVEISAGGLTSGSFGSNEFSLCYSADASVTAIHTPTTGCLLSAHEPVVVEVFNNGGDTLFTWDISYSLDSGTVVTETVNDTLPPSGSHSYTFTATEDFSSTGYYNIDAWVTITNDVQSSNDTLSQQAYLSGTTPMTISTYSGPYAESGVGIAWEIIDLNNNVILSSQEYSTNYTTYVDSFCIVECEDYTINMTSGYSSWYGGNISISTVDTTPEIVATGGVTSNYYATENFRYCNGIDIALTDILIEDGCARSDTENVVVEVSNVATDTIFGFDIGYNLDTLASVTETSTDTILPGQSVQYTFSATVDLSSIGIYSFTAWATTTNDLGLYNDTLNSEVDIYGDFELTLTTSTGNYGSEVSWIVINDYSGDTVAMTNQGAFSSNATYENNLCITTCEYFTIEMHDSFGDGWNGGTYSIDAPNPDSDTLPDINIISGGLSSGDFGTDAFIYCDGIDMGIITSSLNGNGCVQSDSSFISLTIKNFGADSTSSVEVSYILNGGSTVTETVYDTIAPNEEYTHTFTTIEDLSNSGAYQFEAWIVTSGDLVSDNDSIAQDTVWLNGDVALVVATNIEYYYGNYGWAVTNSNNDTIINSVTYGDNFTTFYSDEFCINSCENYNFEMSVGSSWYDGWEAADYTILTPTGIDSIPYETIQEGALASGSYGVDVLSYCIGFDATLHSIPINSTCTAFDDHISIQIENSGTDTIFTLEVNYLLDTAAISVTETINDTIAPGQIYDYTFSAVEDFSAEGTYQLVAWVSSLDDLNNSNDSLATSFDLSGTLPTTININVGGYPGEISWLMINENNDTLITSPSYSGVNNNFTTNICIDECETYTIELFDSFGDGWNGGHITFSSTEVDSTLSDTLFHSTIENILPGNADTYNSGTFFYCEEPDLAITQVNLESGCIASDQEEVVINLQNISSLVNIQEFLLNYSFNGTLYTDSVDLEILTGQEASFTLANSFDLSNVGDHNLEISVNLTGDYNWENDSIIEVISLNTNALPNLQSFDALEDSIINHFDNDAWISNADTISNYVWRTHQGSTPSYPYTGPSSGNGGNGTYLYVEQDNPGDIASITSRCYDLTNAVNPKLGFHYHKSGSDQGDLVVKAQGDTTIVLGTIVGQTQLPGNNPWLFQQYDLDLFIGQTIVLIFEAHKTNDSGSNGDICLDDVNVLDIPEFTLPDTLSCGVDSILITGPDNWLSYAWFSSDTTQIITADTQSVYLYTNSDITLFAYDSLGFYENDTFNLQFVNELEIVANAFDTTICIGESLIIGDSIANAESYVWNTGDSLVSIQVSVQTDSIIELTVSNQCYTEEINYNIVVSDPNATISSGLTEICEGDTIVLSSAQASSYEWTFANSVISTEQSVEVLDDGIYTLVITDEFDCKANENVEVSYLPADSCNVGILESELGDVEIYPNPNDGLFSIKLNPSRELEKVTIFITNTVGEVVYQTYFNKLYSSIKKDIDLTEMARGVYTINIISNSVSETHKLVIYR